jgi:hypothetical protein
MQAAYVTDMHGASVCVCVSRRALAEPHRHTRALTDRLSSAAYLDDHSISDFRAVAATLSELHADVTRTAWRSASLRCPAAATTTATAALGDSPTPTTQHLAAHQSRWVLPVSVFAVCFLASLAYNLVERLHSRRRAGQTSPRSSLKSPFLH